MSFCKPRYDKTVQWEILRSSTELGYTVVGGASKLFNWFVKQYSPVTVLSYCDRCWGDGGVYEKMGMIKSSVTPPSYWLVDPQDPNKVKRHRSAYMKHRLVAMGYDKTMTEHEITQSMGLYRVYDCGTIKYIWSA